jgi:acyl-homoserine lactone acylase PvdQ
MRTVGLNRASQAFIDNISLEEGHALEVFSAGVNKAVENMKVYPAEFYIFWTEFEPWTPLDSSSVMHILAYFLSIDGWNTMLRERLLEVYDQTLVEKMLPFHVKNYF